jgi:hypothetical protein
MATVKYRNSFYDSENCLSREFIYRDDSINPPFHYKGYEIFERFDQGYQVFDIVKNDVCIGMYAGINGAKGRIDNLINETI